MRKLTLPFRVPLSLAPQPGDKLGKRRALGTRIDRVEYLFSELRPPKRHITHHGPPTIRTTHLVVQIERGAE